jgi:Carbohydrate-selective porin, OprB family
VVFDADLLLTPQGVLTGGRDTGWEFWGNADYTLNVDTGKLGLWPGGFLKIYAGSTFGESLFDDTGALVPANAAWLVGDPNEPSTTLMQASFMQFLSPKFGLMAGKFFTLVDDTTQFTGNFRTQFMNTGLAIPMSFALVPISAYGGGVVVLPWEGVVLSALVLDPGGTPRGKGVVPRRPHDTFGVGWARTEFSDDFLAFLRDRLGLGLEREDAIEIFYNASVTSWLNATLDLQIIEPALKKKLSSPGQLTDVDTTVVAGLRFYVRF